MGRGFDFFEAVGSKHAFSNVITVSARRASRCSSARPIAIKRSVDLQCVAAMFNNVGIHEARNDAFSHERFRQALGEFTSEVRHILRLPGIAARPW